MVEQVEAAPVYKLASLPKIVLVPCSLTASDKNKYSPLISASKCGKEQEVRHGMAFENNAALGFCQKTGSERLA